MASTVIVGGGIIGIATAYYLSEHQPGSPIHLVDSSAQLFTSASGYAGGFLARDWFHKDLASLGALSFDEHERLAEQYGGREKWLYAKSVTVNYELPRRKPKSFAGKDWLSEGGSRTDLVDERGEVKDRNSPPWLKRVKGDALSLVDNGEGTAVLDPLRLCQFLLEKCREAGVRIHTPAIVRHIGADCHDELSILVCAGAWTPSVLESMFPGSHINIPVISLAGHSLVVKNPADIGDTFHSVYTSTDTFSPEIYARPNGDIWLGGLNASIRLPPLATGAKPIDSSIEKLKDLAKQLALPRCSPLVLSTIRHLPLLRRRVVDFTIGAIRIQHQSRPLCNLALFHHVRNSALKDLQQAIQFVDLCAVDADAPGDVGRNFRVQHGLDGSLDGVAVGKTQVFFRGEKRGPVWEFGQCWCRGEGFAHGDNLIETRNCLERNVTQSLLDIIDFRKHSQALTMP
ncbi:hypothetical protein HG531_008541 [Fusarium graminearum]|nr:hypothetical protein HG531_008541 [Fusarium graminearum]